MLRTNLFYRRVAAGLALTLALTVVGCGTNNSGNPGNDRSFHVRSAGPTPGYTNQPQGMSTGKKVMLLTGAALVYYLYKKHQAKQASNGYAQGGDRPQLYRSRNGGVYYRDQQGNPVWLTVPQQGMQVPANEVQQYAPDYQQYQGGIPAPPPGYRTQPFTNYDPGLAAGSSY
jgi:hypothetical protein